MLATHSMLENERLDLDAFYQAMVERIEAVHTLTGKQETIRSTTASSRRPSRLDIIFTPVQVVDFIIRSANDTMHTAFNQSLGDPGVAIIETSMPQRIQTHANLVLPA